MGRRSVIFPVLLLTALIVASQVSAQIRRGPKTFVRSGQMIRPDTMARGADSLAMDRLLTATDSATLQRLSQIHSLGALLRSGDDARIDSARRTLPEDSVTLAHFDRLREKFKQADSTEAQRLAKDVERAFRIDSTLLDSLDKMPSILLTDTAKYKQGWFMSDSMSLSKVCWFSLVLPGYGQVYNKQYWKLPVLYGTVGASLGLFFHENQRYRSFKNTYDQIINLHGMDRSPALERAQTLMIRSNTRRQIYLGTAVASYIYFIGDAAINYSTNNVSHVKKATTLACICPGAGQIYNKSYWKVPFVVGGFATLIYCIDWNNRGFQRFKKAYSLKYAFDQDPTKFPNGVSPDEFRGRYTTTYLKNLKDSYRRNRDLCIIITAGLYVLQIVDAHVDAHLKDFDISDDLSMSIEPVFDYTFVPSMGTHSPVFGFKMGFNF